jgi:hypothetical protein
MGEILLEGYEATRLRGHEAARRATDDGAEFAWPAPVRALTSPFAAPYGHVIRIA